MCKNGCCCALQVVLSAVAAVAIGILRYYGYLAGAEPIWAVFALGIAAFVILAVNLFVSRCTSCKQSGSVCERALLAIGTVGTITVSIVALATLDVQAIAAAVIGAFVAFFAALLMSGLVINALGSTNDNAKCRM